MKLLNFTIIKLTCFFIVGIIFGFYFEIDLAISITLAFVCLITLFVIYLLTKRQFNQHIWFGLVSFLGMMSIGILTVNLHNQKNLPNHYSHYISEDLNALHTVTFKVREVLKPGNFYDKYVIDIFKIDDTKAVGKSLLNIEKDSSAPSLKVDDFFVARTNFKNLIHPLNPGQFDYKDYLKKKYIYHQLFVESPLLLKLKADKTTLFGIANSIREHVNTKLKPYNFKPDERAIVNALLLGQRQDISEEVYTSYTNAGAIHILAVSGLHVGIILLILSFALKPLEHFKHGKLIKTILLVLMLWGFAIIAGLSASVTRAVTMFSIVAIGMNLNRPTNIYNTLSISILVILLVKPLFLFDVGFQLSYLAVFSIVTIDPLLYKLWQPKNWLLDKYWHTFTITIAAQFGIIPVSLYYFHQFPGLFFASNLVIIPLLGIILAFGVIVILLSVINLLPYFLASFFGYIISSMNNFISWISKQEAFLFQDIPFGILHVLAFYGLIITFFKWTFRKNFTSLTHALVAIILVQCTFIYTEYSKPEEQFIIFHKSRFSLIGNVNDNTVKFAHDFDSITAIKSTIIRDYTVKEHLESELQNNIHSVYSLKQNNILIIDSLGIYNIDTFKPDYVLLRQSPKINLNRLIDTLHPKQIIADGSNYKSYIERWEAICKKRKLPFHQTSKKGAFIIKY